jgi:flagellar hook-associated protein 2
MKLPAVGQSGLEIAAMVEKIVKADTAPDRLRMSKQATKIDANLSAVGILKSSLARLQTNINKLGDINTLFNLKSTLSDSDHFSVTTTNKASPGLSQIEVIQLAKRQSLSSLPVATPSTVVGSGNLTIQLGSYNDDKTVFNANASTQPIVINIPPEANTLQMICNSINNSNTAVQASIIQDTLGARLTLTSKETGQDYSMQIQETGGLSSLAYDPTQNINALTETVTATNSIVKVNGITLTNKSNTLKDNIAGITLDLKKAEPGKITTLTVENDKSLVTAQLKDFIKQYNDTMNTLSGLGGYNAQTKKAGALQGDAELRTIKLKLSNWAIEPQQNATGAFNKLSQIGITLNRDGLLQMDEAVFNKVLDTNYQDIGTLFAKTANTSDNLVRINGVGANIQAGTYNVVIDAYTPPTTLYGSIGGYPASSKDGITMEGSGPFKDLKIDILGGSTGPRGNITVTDGIGVTLNSFLDGYIREEKGKEGEIVKRNLQLEARMKGLETELANLDIKTEALEKRYGKRFVDLDKLLVKLQQLSGGLAQQLDSLPRFNRG